VQLVERALPHVGEIPVADVLGRCELGTGEIHYPAVGEALDRLGYRGVVGLEGWPSDDPLVPLERFRTAFIVGR
jgi:hydroxypyruvate isomerase